MVQPPHFSGLYAAYGGGEASIAAREWSRPRLSRAVGTPTQSAIRVSLFVMWVIRTTCGGTRLMSPKQCRAPMGVYAQEGALGQLAPAFACRLAAVLNAAADAA